MPIDKNNDTAYATALQPGSSTIFVTGGTGFIGAYIIKNLVEKGFKVRASRRSGKRPFFIFKHILDKVEWVEADVLDVVALNDAMKDVAAVVHSAAVVSFSKDARQEMYKINIEGTANVVNIALENNVQRFLHVSSISALGRTQSGETVTEEKKWEESKSNTHYGISKRMAELEVWRGIEEGLNGVIINPSTVLGFGDWNQSSSGIFKNVYNGFKWYTTGVNGFVGVEDVAEVAVQLLLSDISERRFIVNADNWIFQHLFNTIAEGFGKAGPSRYASRSMREIAWRMELAKSWISGKKPLLTRETAKIAQTKTYFDNSSILEALPSFSFTPLNKGIKKWCENYMEAVQKGELRP